MLFCTCLILLCLFSGSISALEAPANIAVFPGGDSLLHAYISWSDRSDSEDGFAVERKQEEDGAWEEIGRTQADEEAYIDGPLELGMTYFYRVRAFSGETYSAYTDDDYLTATGVPWIRLTSLTDTTYTRPGDTVTVTWEANLVELIAVSITKDDGISWEEISEGGGISCAPAGIINQYKIAIADSLLGKTIKIKLAMYGSQDVIGITGAIQIVSQIGIIGRSHDRQKTPRNGRMPIRGIYVSGVSKENVFNLNGRTMPKARPFAAASGVYFRFSAR